VIYRTHDFTFDGIHVVGTGPGKSPSGV